MEWKLCVLSSVLYPAEHYESLRVYVQLHSSTSVNMSARILSWIGPREQRKRDSSLLPGMDDGLHMRTEGENETDSERELRWKKNKQVIRKKVSDTNTL